MQKAIYLILMFDVKQIITIYLNLNNMKYYIILLVVIFSISYSCNKAFDEYGYYGVGSALFNNQMFDGKTRILYENGFCKPDSCISIKVDNEDGEGLMQGRIILSFVPLKTGKFELEPDSSVLSDHLYQVTYVVGVDDLFFGTYHIYQKDTSNWIIINKFNLQTGDVNGSFQATVVRSPNWLSVGQKPDTIRFSNGKFYGKIYK